MTAQRLPIPGSDDDDWGTILNGFLSVSLGSDGTVLPAALTQSGGLLASNNLSDIANVTTAQTNLGLGSAATLSSTVGGDLSGTLPNPTVANIKGVALPGSAPSAGQVLTATSSVTTAWSTPSSGGGGGSSTLAGDTDVQIASPANNQVLTYSTSSSKWINATPSSAPVTSVAGRTGAIVLAESDITNLSTDLSAKVTKAGDTMTGKLVVPSFQVTGGTLTTGNILTSDSSGNATWQAAPGAVSSLAMGGVISGTTSSSTFTNGASAPVDVKNGGGETYYSAGNSGTAITLNVANGNVQSVVLTANATITLTSPSSGSFRSLLLLVTQDGTGSRTITWPGSIDWGNPGVPTLSTAANAMDLVNLFTVNGGSTWYAAVGIQGY